MKAIILAVWAAWPAGAQPLAPEPPIVDEAALEALQKKPDESPVRRQDAPPLALALELALGATVWQLVEVSTHGPVSDIGKLVRSGHYKLEIIQLVLMSAEARRPLREAVDKRKKGARLAEIALEYRLDYPRVYDAALAVQELVDAQYLPRFPEQRLRRDKDEK